MEVSKAMWLAGLRSLLFVAVAALVVVSVPGCDNPFDPLQSSNKIQGLTFIDVLADQAHWDSDPEWDGVQIEIVYKNEFDEVLTFHDKPHEIQIELWTQVDTVPPSRGSLVVSKTIKFSNSDDLINIPIESYGSSLGIPAEDPITGCVLARVFPPEAYPQKELTFLVCDVEIYTPDDAVQP